MIANPHPKIPCGNPLCQGRPGFLYHQPKGMLLHLSKSKACMEFFQKEQLKTALQSVVPLSANDPSFEEPLHFPTSPPYNNLSPKSNNSNTPDQPIFPNDDTDELINASLDDSPKRPTSPASQTDTPTLPILHPPPLPNRPPNIYLSLIHI